MANPGKIISAERLEQLRAAARKGGLAKGGKKSRKKLEELRVKGAIQQRAMELADKALNSLAVSAFGSYVIAKVQIDEKTNKKRLVPVRDETEIADVIDTGELGIDYFVLEGSAPDWKAAVELIERGIGKVAENKTITVDHQHSFAQLAKARAKLPQVQLLKEKEPIDVSATEIQTP